MKGTCHRCGHYSENLHTPLSAGPDLCPPCIEDLRSIKKPDKGKEFLDINKYRSPKEKEAVNHPDHYGGEGNVYEAIKVIEAWDLDFCLGNTVKYISRAGKKDKTKELEDLKKALWYLQRRIGQLGGAEVARPTLFEDVPRPFCFGNPHEFERTPDESCVNDCGHLSECQSEVNRQLHLAHKGSAAGKPVCFCRAAEDTVATICHKCLYLEDCLKAQKPGIYSHSS